jgi:hypothetical protein
MKKTITIIIFISILIFFICVNRTEALFIESTIDSKFYLVRNINDKIDAANTLATIKHNLSKLTLYLRSKINETKKNNIVSPILEYEPYVDRIYNRIIHTEYKENSTDNNYTSYSVNKGEELVFCIRSKSDNNIHDINLLMYVAIHELAHIGCPEIGHTALFNKINKFLLENSMKIGIYKYKNYSNYPIEYCGMNLNTNILD